MSKLHSRVHKGLINQAHCGSSSVGLQSRKHSLFLRRSVQLGAVRGEGWEGEAPGCEVRIREVVKVGPRGHVCENSQTTSMEDV